MSIIRLCLAGSLPRWPLAYPENSGTAHFPKRGMKCIPPEFFQNERRGDNSLYDLRNVVP